jgi:hypothetical protein
MRSITLLNKTREILFLGVKNSQIKNLNVMRLKESFKDGNFEQNLKNHETIQAIFNKL